MIPWASGGKMDPWDHIHAAMGLALAGYTDREIQKMGRWRGATFKEYVREELHCFSEGMPRSMKKCFNFVNVAGGAHHDVTSATMLEAYNVNVSASAA